MQSKSFRQPWKRRSDISISVVKLWMAPSRYVKWGAQRASFLTAVLTFFPRFHVEFGSVVVYRRGRISDSCISFLMRVG